MVVQNKGAETNGLRESIFQNIIGRNKGRKKIETIKAILKSLLKITPGKKQEISKDSDLNNGKKKIENIRRRPSKTWEHGKNQNKETIKF